MKFLAALLLVGCAAPSYYEVSPYYGTLDLGQRDVDAEDMGVMFTVGWDIGQRAHQGRMEDFAMASLAANPGVDPLVLRALQGAGDDDAPKSEEHIPFMPAVPKTEQEANMQLIYVVVAMALAVMAMLGLLVRALVNSKKDE